MRKEQIVVGDIVHIINRGAKKAQIFRQKSDLWRLLFGLYYLNSEETFSDWYREADRDGNLAKFIWPGHWPKRKPLVHVIGFAIMPNHFHLILKEIKEGGISQFMHKFTMSYSKFINAKYDESGSLFQGKFKSVVVETDEYLRYLAAYVMVKNPFELYPKGGLIGSISKFDDAYEWAIDYEFSSLAVYAGKRSLPIISEEILDEVFSGPADFKALAQDYISGMKFEDTGFEGS